MNFVQPIWLYAISGIIIPIAIHFWNISEGKALRVGSIALLEKTAKRYTNTLRITEWLLLVLRCLLIILLALLLARPVLPQPPGNAKGWVLIANQKPGAVYAHFKTTIDSLLSNGFELHRFDTGFQPVSLPAFLSQPDTVAPPYTYWQLVHRLDHKLPSSFPIHLFTPDKLRYFKGERPLSGLGLTWHAFSPDTLSQQLVKTWRSHDTLHAMFVYSSASGNRFTTNTMRFDQLPPDLAVDAAKGVSYQQQPFVPIDTGVMRIAIYAGGNLQDPRYVEAALEAVKTFTGLNLQTTVAYNPASLPASQDWLFWLSEEPLPAHLHFPYLFRYEKGNIQTKVSSFTGNWLVQPVALSRYVLPAQKVPPAWQTIWENSFGDGILAKETTGSSTLYHFYSRFNPQWNDLAWQEQFPSILLQLICSNGLQAVNAAYTDERAIDTAQMQPDFAGNAISQPANATEDLTPYCLLVLLLLFAIERIVSFQPKQTLHHA